MSEESYSEDSMLDESLVNMGKAVVKDPEMMVQAFADKFAHPVVPIIDTPFEMKLDAVYLLFHQESTQIQLFDKFSPHIVRNIWSDYRGPELYYQVFNGQFIHPFPQTDEEIGLRTALEDAQKEFQNKRSWLYIQTYLFVCRFDKDAKVHITLTIIDQILVITTVIVTVLQTYDKFAKDTTLAVFEGVASVYFTFTYVFEAIVVRNRTMYLTRIMSIFDFLAIIPWYMELAVGNLVDLEILSILKVFRLLRLTKLPALNSPYGDIIIESISLWAKKTGAMIAMYVMILVIGVGVFLTSDDEVSNGIVGMFRAFMSLASTELPVEKPFTEMKGLILGTCMFTIVCSVSLVSAIINALTLYFVLLSVDYEKRKMAIAETMYDHYAKDYDNDIVRAVAVKYYAIYEDAQVIYGHIRETLVSKYTAPTAYDAPYEPELINKSEFIALTQIGQDVIDDKIKKAGMNI